MSFNNFYPYSHSLIRDFQERRGILQMIKHRNRRSIAFEGIHNYKIEDMSVAPCTYMHLCYFRYLALQPLILAMIARSSNSAIRNAILISSSPFCFRVSFTRLSNPYPDPSLFGIIASSLSCMVVSLHIGLLN